MPKRANRSFKTIAVMTALVMMITQFSGIFTYMISGSEDILLSNDFIEVEVNDSNGRYSIGTKEGSITRDDSNQAMLFDEYEPETTFTTFKIDGEEYIFGNDYGFLGDDSYFSELPTSTNIAIQNGDVNSCTWVIKGVEIEQRLEVTETELNAGNVKISYIVNNKSGADIKIGSRILLDTMLGSNDGAPIKIAGSSSFVQTEQRFVGEDIPLYWNAYAGNQDLDMMTYGIIEGWQEQYLAEGKDANYATVPDELVIAHWYSLSDTKWDVSEDSMLDFTSENNQYGTSDSAVAMYWNPDTLADGEERLFETYYGLGQYATAEKRKLLELNVYAPNEVAILEDNTDYAVDTIEISGDISHRFIEDEKLLNATVKLQFSGEGLTFIDNQESNINLGDLEANTVESFSWSFEPDDLTTWETFTYEVHLNADNLDETIVRRGKIMVPPVHGSVPDLQIEAIAPENIYYADDDNQFIIKGHGLEALEAMDSYSVKLVRPESDGSVSSDISSERTITIDNSDLTISEDNIVVKLVDTLTTDDLGIYDVVIDYTLGDISLQRKFDQGFNISNETKYSKKYYSILLVVRNREEDKYGYYSYNYEIVAAKDESEIRKYYEDDIMLEIRGPRIYESDGLYFIDNGRNTINSILTIDNTLTIPMVLYEAYDGVVLEGFGGLFLDYIPFMFCPFKITLENGSRYSSSDSELDRGRYYPIELNIEDIEDMWLFNAEEKDELSERIFDVVDYYHLSIKESAEIEGFPVRISGAILTKEKITFSGSINLGQVVDRIVTNNYQYDKSGFDSSLDVTVEELSFARKNQMVMFERLRFNGAVGITSNLFKEAPLLGLETIGGSAVFNGDIYLPIGVPSYDDVFDVSLKVDLDMMVAKGNAFIQIKKLFFGSIPIPMIDEVNFYAYYGDRIGASLLGLDFVKFEGSGGFKFDGTTNNYINSPPKITLNGKASLLGDRLVGANAHFIMDEEKFDMRLDNLDVLGHKLIDDVHFKVTPEGFNGGGALNYFGIIGGSVNLEIKDKATNVGLLKPTSLKGSGTVRVQIPEFVPVFGGLGFDGLTLGVNDDELSATVKAKIFFVTINKTLKFKMFTDGITLVNLDEQLALVDSEFAEPIFSEDGELIGIVDYGDGLNLEYNSMANNTVASTDGLPDTFVDGERLVHKLDMSNFDVGIIEVNPVGDIPELTLINPNGDEYSLIENESYYIREVDGEIFIDIAVAEIIDGEWVLTSSNPISVKMYNLENSTTITSAEATANGKNIDLNWEGQLLEGNTVTINLIDDSEEASYSFTEISTVNAETGTSQIVIPNKLASGTYQVELQVMNESNEVVFVYRIEEAINYIDQGAPEGISSLELSNSGSATIQASWDINGSADGTIINVYHEESMEEVKSYVYEDDTNSMIIGESMISDTSGLLEPGVSYIVEVGTYNKTDDLVKYSTPMSKSITINEVNTPIIEFNLDSRDHSIINQGVVEGLSTYTSRHEDMTITLTSDTEVTLEVIEAGISVYSETGTEFNVPVTLVEGDNGIGITATNLSGDKAKESFSISLDTNAPVLFIEEPLQGSIHTEDFVLGGYAESTETITLNNSPLEIATDGTFNKVIALEAAMSQTLTLVARDIAGNEAIYISEVFNGNVLEAKNIRIVPVTNQIVLGESVDYNAVIIDANNREYLIDDRLVNWSVLSTEGLLSVNEDGVVTGEVLGLETLIASYELSDEYVLDDGAIIEVVAELKETMFIESSPDLIGLGIEESYQINTYESLEDDTKRIIDTRQLSYEVLTGKSVVGVDEYGFVESNEEGKAVVRVSYEKNDITYESYIIIIVSTDNVDISLGRLTDEDLFIINALVSVIKQESIRKHQILAEAMNTENGVSQISLPNSFIDLAFGQEVENGQGNKSIYIELPSIYGTSEYQVTLAKGVLATTKFNNIVVETYFGNLILPTNIMAKLESSNDYGDQQVTIVIREVITDTVDPLIGQRPIVSIGLYEGVGNSGESLELANESAYIGVELRYYMKSNEEAKYIGIAKLVSEQSVELVSLDMFHKESKLVGFRTREFATYGVSYNEVFYNDLNLCKWSEELVESLTAKGVIKQNDSTSFNPYGNIQLGELLEWLNNGLNWTPSLDELVDLNNDGSLSREEVIRLIAIAYRETNYELILREVAIPNRYSDIGTFSINTKNEVAYMVEKGFIVGDLYNLEPLRLATRAEVAVVLWRIMSDMY